MDYRTITDINSEQWELQQEAYTDTNGLRKIDDYYCVALGTYYSQECGKKFKISLDSGIFFKVIVADIKDPTHTDELNMYTPLEEKGESIFNSNNFQMVNVIEFIVDKNVLPREISKITGDVSNLGLRGNITKIEEVYDVE